MKRFKHFTIDEELADKLKKEPNASKIVNDLLIEHYKFVRPEGQSDKERLIYLKKEREKEILKEKYDKKLAALNGN